MVLPRCTLTLITMKERWFRATPNDRSAGGIDMKRLGITALLVLLSNTTAQAGVVFEVETTDHEQSPPRTQDIEINVEGRNLSIPIAAKDRRGSDGQMIFRGDRGENGEVVMVDHDNKSYFVMGDAAIKAISGQLGMVQQQMQEVLKNLPQEQRDVIEKMRKQGVGPGIPFGQPPFRPKTEVKPTGERTNKGGYPAAKFEVLRGDAKVREFWTTDWDNIDGGEEAADAFRAMGAFFRAIMDSMATSPGGDTFGANNPYADMNFETGFPVVMNEFGEDGSLENESTLRKTRRQRIDPDAFEPPSGYKRMSMGPQ